MKTSTLLALHTAAVAALLTAAGCTSVESRGHGSLFGKTDPNQTEGDIIQPGQEVNVTKSEVQAPKTEVQAPKAEVQAPKAEVQAPKAEVQAPAKDIRPVGDVGRPGTYPEFVNVPDGLQGNKGVHAAQVNAEGKSFPKPESDARPVVAGPAPTGPAVPKVKTVHVVQAGETLGHIAQKYKVPRSEILKVNSMGDPNRIRVGQKINIPEYDASKAPKRASGHAAKTVTAPAGGSVHTVAAGEMVGSIAHKYGLKTGDVLRANGLTEETAKKIHVGQQLVIPAKTDANTYTPSKEAPSRPAPVKEETAAPAPVVAPYPATPATPVAPAPRPAPAAPVVVSPAHPAPVAPAVPTVQPTVPGAAVQPGAVKTYVVQPGDDLVTIASRFNTSKITLIQLNNMTLSDTLQPGTTIRVP